MNKETLVDIVLSQIEQDFAEGDVTAIAELLMCVPEENLRAYLSEAPNTKE